MADYQLGVIGGGNMGEALVRGIVDNSPRMLPNMILVSEPVQARREVFMEMAVEAVDDNAIPARCPCVILAVKPQVMAAVLTEIAPHVRSDAIVISIAAGIGTAAIDKGLGGKGRIIRVMPNMPLLAGEGMSAVAAGPRATPVEVAQTQEFFGFRGKTIVVEEELMDAVTAVSGSGPAYVFYLVEAMIAAGEAEGLTEADARLLAVQTCRGAVALLEKTAADPAVLRKRVTSPGGTTQEALSVLDGAHTKETLVKAIRAAARRSRELGGK